jgi:O-antigen polysaccharide polymerase Wzy
MNPSLRAAPALLPAAVSASPDRHEIAFLPLHIVTTALAAASGLMPIALHLYEPLGSHDVIAGASGLSILGLIAYTRYFLRLPALSASVVYLSLFWIFHCGMTFTGTLIPSVLARLEGADIEWYYWPNVRFAMLLSVIGAAGFVFGVGLFGRSPVAQRLQAVDEHAPSLYLTGWVLLLVGLGATLAILVQAGGPAILSMSYLDFRSAVLGPTNLQSTLDLSQAGCLLTICGAGGRRWLKPLLLWSFCAALPVLLVGLRSQALVPLVTFAVILGVRGVRLPKRALVVALLIISVLIPAVQAFRLVGFGNRSLVNWTEVTPLDTLMELGGSIRATKAYVDWIESGDAYLLGASYWAPFDRQVLVRVIPGREPIPYEKDERVPIRLMDTREGAVGASATGEAYYNFGAVGPFIFYMCVGVLFGWLERRGGRSPWGCAVLGMVMFLFYFNIRGDWLAVPAQLGQFLVLLGVCHFLGRFVPVLRPPVA